MIFKVNTCNYNKTQKCENLIGKHQPSFSQDITHAKA